MTLPSTIPGLSRDEACRASELAEGLTNGAIFVLMAILYFQDKGRSTRVLRSVSLFRRKSVTEPLRIAGQSLEDILKTLEHLEFIETSWGLRTLRCTENGDVVKHCFSTLRVSLRVYRAYPQLGMETLADIDKLRLAMRALCEGKPL